MKPALKSRPPRRGREDVHAWLDLVVVDGPFLSRPAVKAQYPDGLPRPDAAVDEVKSMFRTGFTRWEKAWTKFARSNRFDAARSAYVAERNLWVDTFVTEVLEWGTYYRPGSGGIEAASLDGEVSVEPTGRLATTKDGLEALLLVVEPTDDLAATGTDGWSASPIDRAAALLRTAHRTGGGASPVALVTDGRWWCLVWAGPGGGVGSGTFDGALFREEPDLRDAFWALTRLAGLAGGAEQRRLPALLQASIASTEDITNALGSQVRSAVELLVQSFSESHLRADGDSPLPADGHEVYDAAVTVMMRVVFLLFAEANELLPEGDLFHRAYAVSGVGDALDARVLAAVGVEGEELLEGSYDTWHRILATSQALFEGATFEDLRMPAYGGSLFDPQRFPWLSAADGTNGRLRVLVDDRVMFRVLRAVQHVKVDGEDRTVSFRELDVEQIGYVYEGLLGYSARFTEVDEVIIGLDGPEAGSEPEIPLSVLHELADDAGEDSKLFASLLIAWVKKDQPGAKARTPLQVAKAYAASGAVDAQDEARRLLRPVVRNRGLVDELAVYIGLVRRDLRGLPYVVLGGGLVVVETRSRATSGTHYTPRSLAEEVVLHALEPLVYSPGPLQTADSKQWVPISASQILELKIADIAVGSGAFLVAAARYLGRALLDAWDREGVIEPSAGAEERRSREVEARREVIARCLYGADINAMAVEMCKLSLWLVSLDPDRPFSFVDDKIFCGNSLLGLSSVDQLRGLHIDPSPERLRNPGFTVDVDGMLDRATELRHQLAVPVSEADAMRSIRGKQSLMVQLDANNAILRDVADGVIAAGMALGGKPGRALDDAYEALSYALMVAYAESGRDVRSMLDGILDRGLTPTVETDYPRWKPLHWVLEVPDVMIERGGFDAVVGNPPFLGAKKMSPVMGHELRAWLVNQIGGGAAGNADLVAYFFLRASNLTDQISGLIGLIATNSIAQGETRRVALDPLLDSGWSITRAVQSAPWPARGAALEYAAVWMSRLPLGDEAVAVADGVRVNAISSLLEPEGRVQGTPEPLVENFGKAFQGSTPLDMGFMISRAEAEALLEVEPRNAAVLFPYLNGEDLNGRSDSSARRWIINFGDMDRSLAERFTAVWRIADSRIGGGRSERIAKNIENSVAWWKYWRRRDALYESIKSLDQVLALTRVSKTVMPLRVPADQVFADALVVFADDDYSFQATLSSCVHQIWSIKHGGSMRRDPAYRPRAVFLTLPLPMPSVKAGGVMETLESTRSAAMRDRGLGSTEIYNLVNDPNTSFDPVVLKLRDLHEELDLAVLAAFGWDDLPLNHGFYTYRQIERFTISPASRVELMDRLLEENLRRAALQGIVGGAGQDDPMTEELVVE